MKSVLWLCCPPKSLHSRFNSLLYLFFLFLVIRLNFVVCDYGSSLQVYKVFCTYAEGTGLKIAMAAGQKSFAVEQATLLEVR